jgi:pimeloyl-ACP methyl ester carboxylesterase
MWKVLILSFWVGACLAIPHNPREETDEQDRFVQVPDFYGNMITIDNDVPVPPTGYFEAEHGVKFFLYTKNNPEVYQEILMDIDSIKNSNFNSNRKTRFIIHGWGNDVNSNFNIVVRRAMLEAADVNAIVVDWSDGTTSLSYLEARDRIYDVGPYVARFINFLYANKLIASYKDVNIIGHSLGAHVAGIAGKNTREKVAIIFGLDPAGPLFYMSEPERRLNFGDALQTVSVHTNGRFKGFYRPITNVDIYANGGWVQPGCGFDLDGRCSHARAYELFAEAATTQEFIAKKCNNFEEIEELQCAGIDDLVFVAETNQFNAQGIYNLDTNEEAPFAMGV